MGSVAIYYFSFINVPHFVFRAAIGVVFVGGICQEYVRNVKVVCGGGFWKEVGNYGFNYFQRVEARGKAQGSEMLRVPWAAPA